MKAYAKIFGVILVALVIQLALAAAVQKGGGDDLISRAFTVTSNTDSIVSRAFTVTSNTDSIVSRAFTVTSNTDSIVSRAFTVTSNTDSIVSRAFTAVNCEDGAGGLCVDCNGNDIPDQCEIDCGTKGGPCDIPGCGMIVDCNDNDVPDECDIANGTSQDENGDGIPDECCTGKEKIKKAKGKTKCKKGVVKKLSIFVKLIKGSPGDTFTVTLDNGLSKDGTLKSNGSGKAKFKSKKCNDFSPGDFTATATWSCGTTADKNGTVPQDCPCP